MSIFIHRQLQLQLCAVGYQSVLADNEQTLGAVDLSQADFLVESAVASHHHGNAIWEASLRDVRGRAQDRRGQVIDLKTRLPRQKVHYVNHSWRKFGNGSAPSTDEQHFLYR